MDPRNRFCMLLFLLSVLLVSFSKKPPTPPGVQVVYESDTRGYYLPCG